ncbi:MAG: DUF1820 family protein [Gammaproteobacteria bacterium]|nr:DUF1820 family protein [Gammaproteobacteria bacterium]
MKKEQNPIYKVIFLNQGSVYEIYVKQVYQSELYGFIEVEEFIFGERSQVVVDPSEEKLKAEFDGVTRSFIPVGAIIRIDEVNQGGVAKVVNGGGNVAPFPINFSPPPKS